jgi:8-oxo-dGTP pyrophosphatase MutT (NUDIX family)
VRDAEGGLEVFMVKRHHQIDFVAGALVFPGGKTSQGDLDAALDEYADGISAWSAEARGSCRDGNPGGITRNRVSCSRATRRQAR